MLHLIILTVIVAALFIYSLTTDTGKNTKFGRKRAHTKTQDALMKPSDMVELS
ncbi:MAG: hypothetical protein ACI9C4_000814 [Paraglaciecola sp.]|jgi:hypothetical protein